MLPAKMEVAFSPPDPDAPRVLIVEDDLSITTVLRYLIEREGYEATAVYDGRAAVRIIESEAPPKLVLLDYMLPFLNGGQVIRYIRQTESWQDVPILVLSGRCSEDDVVACLEAGANDYVTKPFRPTELMARVRRLLRPRGRRFAIVGDAS